MKIEWSPPGKLSWTSQRKYAIVSSSTGSSWAGSSGTPANLSGAGRAKRSASSSWPSPRTLTTKHLAPSIAVCVGSLLAMQTSSSTGSSERDATALAVIPAGLSSCSVVITVTPVAKWPIASRNAISSTAVGAGGAVWSAEASWSLATAAR